MELVFATHNQHKFEEAHASLGSRYPMLSLSSLGWTAEIAETEESLLGNARLKARAVYSELKRNCFADDTGLEIEALNGQPGVRTARFAGDSATGQENREKILQLMKGQNNRRAAFKTVIVLILNGQEHVFEGRVDGEITTQEHGAEGFGYDPIFRPAGFNQTYAEMPLEERARISHRALAIQEMRRFFDGFVK